MKNLLVLGSARSGKSTFARMVHQKLGYNIVAIDALVSAFQETFPEIGIKHHGICNNLISPFVASYIHSLVESHPGCKFVVEGWHMHPDNAVKLINRDLFDMVVLGYPKLTSEEAFAIVRKTEKPSDYTVNMNDEYLLDLLYRHINHSQQFQKDCSELGLDFVDTSYNRQEVLDNLLKRLCDRI